MEKFRNECHAESMGVGLSTMSKWVKQLRATPDDLSAKGVEQLSAGTRLETSMHLFLIGSIF